MATKGDGGFDENAAYDRFPAGADMGYGPEQGFNVKRRLNDPSLFTKEALADPVIDEFVKLPFDISYLQTKSSSREAEWLLHKPHLVLDNQVEGIDTSDGRFDHPGHIRTVMINHERTMARWKQSVILVQDDDGTTQVVYKQTTET
jgi:hypothetical protein